MTDYEREAAALYDMLCTFTARWELYSDQTKSVCRALFAREREEYCALFRQFTDAIDRIEEK